MATKGRRQPDACSSLNRRDFLALTAASATVVWAEGARAAAVPVRPKAGAPDPAAGRLPAGGTMPMRSLGKTGVKVSLLGLGGFHIGVPESEKVALRIVHTAIDHGVNFMDNCWDYHEGNSHKRMGLALRGGYRQKVFLMTKIDGRTRQAAEQQIDQSLRDLKTDVIDLMQIHEVIRASDPKRVFGADGAMEALLAAKQAGKIRFIGFTGHKSAAFHLAMIERAARQGFTFDAVQMPLNVMDAAHEDGFEKRVLPVLVEREIGVLGMKPLGSGLFLESTPIRTGKVTAIDCLQYAMNLPTATVITGCETLAVLMQGLGAAMRFTPRDDTWMRNLVAKTAPAADDGWEKYKLTETFDGTSQHPWWLDTARIKR